jgi:hypothetical protein
MKGLFAVVAGILIAGCAAPRLATMSAQPQGEVQEVRFNQGAPSIVSKGHIASVVVAPENNGSGAHIVNERVLLLVGVKNNSDRPFNIQEANVTATMDGAPLKVWTAQEVEEDVRSQAATARTWATIGSVLGAFGAGMSGQTYYSGYAGNTYFSGTAYNPGAVNAAMNQQAAASAASFNSIDQAEAAGLATVRGLLKATTVDPGAIVTGWVQVSVPESRSDKSRYEVTVVSGGEGHIFVFDERVAGANKPSKPSQDERSAAVEESGALQYR